MTDNMLDLVKKAVATWRKYHGNDSLYGQCQRFDGWYMQFVFQGNEKITTYSSAQLAANASTMDPKVTSVNDKDIQIGDRLYFKYPPFGHIVTAVGWDGDRLLVSNTANGGDTVIKLSNNVKIHHADTINLPFIGASRTNGNNKRITGLKGYMINQPVVAGSTTKKLKVASNRRSVPSTAGAIRATYPKGKLLTVDTFKRGQKVTVNGVTSDIWFGIKGTGNYVAAACFTDQKTTGLKDNGHYDGKKPASKKRYARINKAWYAYRSESNAANGVGYSNKFMLPKGDYELVNQNDTSSPYQVKSDLGLVWLGTRRTAPTIIKK